MTTRAYQVAEQRYANLEHTFNNLGYVPVVSSVTGSVRSLLGTVQTILGSVASIFKSAQYFITRNREHRNEAAANSWYGYHGACNGTRGIVEFVPVFGNIATFFYDNVVGLRVNYTYEKLPSGVDPIMESKERTVKAKVNKLDVLAAAAG